MDVERLCEPLEVAPAVLVLERRDDKSVGWKRPERTTELKTKSSSMPSNGRVRRAEEHHELGRGYHEDWQAAHRLIDCGLVDTILVKPDEARGRSSP